MNSWQKVIFINYGWVENELLDLVLEAPEGTSGRAAKELGLENFPYRPEWKKCGFVTVIRNNWDILPKEKIAALLEMSIEKFDALLLEYDFLGEKLGPQPAGIICPKYAELSEAEKEETKRIRKAVGEVEYKPSRLPFDFFGAVSARVEMPETQEISERFVASYNARYGGALDDDGLPDYPDEYLLRLQNAGTTGIWISETLRHLAYFPFDPSESEGYEKRVGNLRKLTEKCAKFGLNVYLYLNEPRSLPSEFFVKYPDIRGQQADDGSYCMCTSSETVRTYLYEAFRSLAEGVPLLKGVMTITMSENPTHCYSKNWKGISRHTECPRCGRKTPEEVCAELNNLYAGALRDGNGHTVLIANLWGWAENLGWNEEQALRGIGLLDKSVDVLCVSEASKKFRRGGVDATVIDYSISEPGPSEITKKLLSYAKMKGHKVWAKIQVNNSWECSAVPYLPVFDLFLEHIRSVKALGTEGLMMGWSLGGYPGGALPVCNLLCADDKADIDGWYESTFDTQADCVRRAQAIFCEAFREFPFSVDSLYFGGQTLGPANAISVYPQNRESSMVCFCFDDYEKYTAPYGIDVYLSQYGKLISKWKEGLELLKGRHGNDEFRSFCDVSEAALIHFESAYIIGTSAKYKRISGSTDILDSCRKRMAELITGLIGLVSHNATIGFEMTNHYYYNVNLLILRLLEVKYEKT